LRLNALQLGIDLAHVRDELFTRNCACFECCHAQLLLFIELLLGGPGLASALVV
jgi:hypothetical protein